MQKMEESEERTDGGAPGGQEEVDAVQEKRRVQRENPWSWGAFMLDPFFILAIRKYSFLFVYLLYLVPLLNFFIILIIKIYLGLQGHKMARESPAFGNEDERRGFMNAIDHAGFITFIFFVVMFVVSMLLVAIAASVLPDLTLQPAVTPTEVPDVTPVP